FMMDAPDEYRSALLSIAQDDAQGRQNTRDTQRKAGETRRHQHGNLRAGVHVVFDHYPQSERQMREKCDQQQHHEECCERRLQPCNEGGVVAATKRDERGCELECQGYESDGHDALKPPRLDTFSGRTEPAGATERRAHALSVHHPRIELTIQAATVSSVVRGTWSDERMITGLPVCGAQRAARAAQRDGHARRCWPPNAR